MSPRADPDANRRAIRAYHRASAALRDRHREEWEELRAYFLEHPGDLSVALPPGPARGRQPAPPGDVGSQLLKCRSMLIGVTHMLQSLRKHVSAEVWKDGYQLELEELKRFTAQLSGPTAAP